MLEQNGEFEYDAEALDALDNYLSERMKSPKDTTRFGRFRRALRQVRYAIIEFTPGDVRVNRPEDSEGVAAADAAYGPVRLRPETPGSVDDES